MEPVDPFMESIKSWNEPQPKRPAWHPQIPQKAYQDSAYYRICPMCRGHLERRGDYYTCSACPYEWPQAGEARDAWRLPVIALKTSEFKYSDDDFLAYLEEQRANGQPAYAALRKPETLELRGGKIPIPGAQPYDTSSEGVPLYNVMDLGWNPDTQMRENADVNEVSGAPEQRGIYVTVPARRWGEVIDWDASLEWAYITIPLNYPEGGDVRLHPMSASAWVPFNDLRPLFNVTKSPFRGR